MDVKDIIDEINSLEGDAKEGALDALEKVLGSRKGGGGRGKGGKFKVDIDPELEEPEMPPVIDDTEYDIEDPDNLLKRKKDTSKDDTKKSEKGEEGEEMEEPEVEEPTIDDIKPDLPDITKTMDEKDRKTAEDLRRKATVARTEAAIKSAIKELEKDGGREEDIEKLKEALDKLKELKDSGKLTEISTGEFDELINDILSKIDKLLDLTFDVDPKNRMKKIDTSLEDELTKIETEQEDEINKEGDPTIQKIKAKKDEEERYKKDVENASGALKGGLDSFKKDLEKAIKDQITKKYYEIEETTFALPNRHHEDDGVAAPATRIDEIELPKKDRPTVDVYFDQSGSWGEDEVERGMEAIANILTLKKSLTVNIYYFSEILTQDQAAARSRGGRECWDLVIDNINAAPKTKNVIMITDSDIGHNYYFPGQHGCKAGPGTTVEGCVWFIWKDSDRVIEAPMKLKGRKGTFQYYM